MRFGIDRGGEKRFPPLREWPLQRSNQLVEAKIGSSESAEVHKPGHLRGFSEALDEIKNKNFSSKLTPVTGVASSVAGNGLMCPQPEVG